MKKPTTKRTQVKNMDQAHKDYEKLKTLSRRARTLTGISYLLDWDQETFMPRDGSDIRGDQLQIMAGIIHRERTGKPYVNALGKLVDLKTGKLKGKSLGEREKAAVREWHRDWKIENVLPAKFVEDFAKLTATSMDVWKHARKANDFKTFAPFLEKIVEMNKKKADYIGYENKPYDALLDLYEPDVTSKIISPLFEKLKTFLVEKVKKIKKNKEIDDSFLNGKWDADKQLAFGRKILNDMGYDFNKGRLDLSAHPFSSSIHPYDSRITTRLTNPSIISNISTSLHEGGHSLYEMGLPVDDYGTPLSEAISYGIHESQSRWWETRIGLSKPFWEAYLPQLKKEFPAFGKVNLETFYKAANKVEPSLIRVEADEVTYSLHVILRYEMEEALIHGKLKIKDVPSAWNEKMEKYLGVKPESDANGCMQDVHWSMGAFGYFPSYTIGNLYAAQFFEAFAKQHKDWEKRVSKGDLVFIKEWLNNNIHKFGKQYSSQELLKKVTGKEFTVQPYLDYINDKYSGIYKL